MKVTTIKVYQKTKTELTKLKQEQESYDEVITHLIETSKNKELEHELVKGYQATAKRDRIIAKDWEASEIW